MTRLSRTCLKQRLANQDAVRSQVMAGEGERNANRATVEWRFTTDDARIKLKRFYPSVSV